jgi:hypothetical protein
MDLDRAFGLIFAMHSTILTVAILAAMAMVAVLLTITAVKVVLNEHRLRMSQQELTKARLDPAGRPYPPSARGLCSRCRQVHPVVHYLSDGTALCRVCYDQQVVGEVAGPAAPPRCPATPPSTPAAHAPG